MLMPIILMVRCLAWCGLPCINMKIDDRVLGSMFG